MAVQPIMLLGNPVLRTECAKVRDVRNPELQKTVSDLRDTLADFRAKKGFGRGIAAPQIGATAQVIYIDYEYTGALVNPRITRRSRKKFNLWDDCFSFPDLLVRVERNMSIEVEFQDESGTKRSLKAEGSLSELLQHEIDHLHGVLAIDRAFDSRHIIFRSELDKLSHPSAHTL